MCIRDSDAVDFKRNSPRCERGAHLACRHVFAATEHATVRQRGGARGGPRKGAPEATLEDAQPRDFRAQRREAAFVDGVASILQGGERGEFAARLRRFGPADRRAVSGQIQRLALSLIHI